MQHAPTARARRPLVSDGNLVSLSTTGNFERVSRWILRWWIPDLPDLTAQAPQTSFNKCVWFSSCKLSLLYTHLTISLFCVPQAWNSSQPWRWEVHGVVLQGRMHTSVAMSGQFEFDDLLS